MPRQTPDILAQAGQVDVDAVAAAMGPQVERISTTKIRLDGGTQPRAGIAQSVVDDYHADMANGSKFPPVELVFDGTDYWLWDGFHRLHAFRRDGDRAIPAHVRQGTRRDAVLLSVGANATHGFRRTNEDKRRAVLALLHDEEWRQWSDREIARRCAVSNQFVSNLRADLSVNDGQMPAERRVVRNGTEYTMTPPQRSAAPAVAAQGGNLAEIWQIEQAIRAWLPAFEEPMIVLENLKQRRWASAYWGDLMEAGELPENRRKGDVFQAINNVLDQIRQAEKPATPTVEPYMKQQPAYAIRPETEQEQQVRADRMAAAMEYDRQRREMQRCAVDTFVAYAEDHGYTGILRWLAYRVHETAQWEDLAHLSRRELWRLIGDNLIGQVMARYDKHASLEQLRAAVDERFNDAGLNGVLWPED